MMFPSRHSHFVSFGSSLPATRSRRRHSSRSAAPFLAIQPMMFPSRHSHFVSFSQREPVFVGTRDSPKRFKAERNRKEASRISSDGVINDGPIPFLRPLQQLLPSQ